MGRGKLLGKPGKMLLEEVACNGLLAFHWGWGGGGGRGGNSSSNLMLQIATGIRYG